VVDDHVEPENFVIHMVRKMELVVQLHESMFGKYRLGIEKTKENICNQKKLHYVFFFW
jgi:hypothetical protein